MKSKADVLQGLSSYYSKDLDDKGRQLYVHLLKGYKLEQVAEAAAQAMANEEKFPLFKTLRKYLDEEKMSKLDDDAIQQANYCKVHFETGASPNFSDPITNKIMKTILKFEDWKRRTPEDIAKFFQGQFVKEYKRIFLSNHERSKLKSRKEIEGETKKDDDSHITEAMKLNRQWVKDMEKMTGEVFERYIFHPWAIYEGYAHRGYAINFNDPHFRDKLKDSKIFAEDFPRAKAFLDGKNKKDWPPARVEIGNKLASEEKIKSAMAKSMEVIKASKGSRINREPSYVV